MFRIGIIVCATAAAAVGFASEQADRLERRLRLQARAASERFMEAVVEPTPREEITSLLVAVVLNGNKIGEAIRIADQFFLTARHVARAEEDPVWLAPYDQSSPPSVSVLIEEDATMDLALLWADMVPVHEGQGRIGPSLGSVELGDRVSCFASIGFVALGSEEIPLRSEFPLEVLWLSNGEQLGKLRLVAGSPLVETEGRVLLYNATKILSHFERFASPARQQRAQKLLLGPQTESLSSIVSLNGYSGAAVFKHADGGYTLVGMVTKAIGRQSKIEIASDVFPYEGIQENATLFLRAEAMRAFLERVSKDGGE